MKKRKRVGICLPGYIWCGPGCGGSGPPQNAVDSCCMKHDLCYQKYGSSKVCDEAFLKCLESKRNPSTQEGRNAIFMHNVMKLRNLFRL